MTAIYQVISRTWAQRGQQDPHTWGPAFSVATLPADQVEAYVARLLADPETSMVQRDRVHRFGGRSVIYAPEGLWVRLDRDEPFHVSFLQATQRQE